ncbi:MAG: type II toxin-antitoxin system VapC family toxin [bacterium]
MKLLLDTCTFLWIVTDSANLSPHAKELFLNEENEVYLSVISSWEITLKYQLNRLELPTSPKNFIPEECENHAISLLPFTQEDINELQAMPELHKDDFDRLLICQAKARNLTFLTPYNIIRKYPIKVDW